MARNEVSGCAGNPGGCLVGSHPAIAASLNAAKSSVSIRAAAIHRFSDQLCNVGIGFANRVSGEVGIARRRLGLRMAKQFADHRKAETAGGSVRCKRMAEVVNTNVLKADTISYTSPRSLEIGEMCAGLVPDNCVGVGGDAGDGFRELYPLRAEVDSALTRLGIVEPDFFALEIDAPPLEFLDFAKPAARNDQ